MPTIDIYNAGGDVVGSMDLNENVFGADVRTDVMHEVVVNYLANQRQGSIRAPQWVGGGVALGPKPRDYRYAVNKKVRRLALKSALSAKVQDSELIVLDAFEAPEIKTKQVAELLKNLKVTEKALIVLPENDKNIVASARNIKGVDTTYVGAINTYEVLSHTKCIILKDAVTKLEEVYA